MTHSEALGTAEACTSAVPPDHLLRCVVAGVLESNPTAADSSTSSSRLLHA
jgi:hypothetical protein